MAEVFRERVLPSVAAWLLVPAGGALVGIMLLPIGVWVGVLGTCVVALVVAVLLWRASPKITVQDGVLTVDRARLPIQVISAVDVLDRPGTEQAMGPDLDARAYLRHRAWAEHSVRVVLADPEDPTPYWLLSTRRPVELAAALGHQRSRTS